MAVRIGELLLKEKRITPDQLQQALNHQKANGGKLGYNLVKMGFVKDEEITALLSKQYGVPVDQPRAVRDRPGGHQARFPPRPRSKYQIVPLSRAGATLTIAMTDPTNVFAMDDIKFMTGYNVEPVVASEIGVIEAIQKYYPSGKGGARRRRGARRQPARGGGTEHARDGEPGPRGAAGARSATPATSRSSRSCRRSAPRRSPSRAKKRRSSGW